MTLSPASQDQNSEDISVLSPINTDPTVHYHIGTTQNWPHHIGTFLRTYSDDPAIKVRACFI